MPDGRFIDESDWPAFRALLRAWNMGELSRLDQPEEKSVVQQQQSCLVVLLEDLVSGGVARAERLRREDEHEVQDIMVVGAIPTWDETEEEEPPTFTLKVPPAPGDEQGEIEEDDPSLWLPEVPINATAKEVLELYTKKESPVRKYLVGVSLGGRSTSGGPIMRWRLVFKRDTRTDEPRPLLEVGPTTLGEFSDILIQHVPYVGTGYEQSVYSVIPTGDPTPIRAGSQCGLRHFPGTGWGVTEAEPRKFEPAIGDDYPYYGAS